MIQNNSLNPVLNQLISFIDYAEMRQIMTLREY